MYAVVQRKLQQINTHVFRGHLDFNSVYTRRTAALGLKKCTSNFFVVFKYAFIETCCLISNQTSFIVKLKPFLSKSACDWFPQKTGRAKASAKPSCAQKAKATAVTVALPVVQVQAPADPLPPVSEESADVSMKEEQELCQAFSEALLTVQDVDEEDADLPQLCSQYVKDIYNYLHVLEVTYSSSARLSAVTLHRLCISAVCLHRCSRRYEPTTCRVMKSLNACELF